MKNQMTLESTFSNNPEAGVARRQDPGDSIEKSQSLGRIERRETKGSKSGDSVNNLNPTILHGTNPGRNQVRTYFRQKSLLQIQEAADTELDHELGGVLLGVPTNHEDRYQVEIHAALPATSEDHGPVHYTFTADTWATIHKRRLERYPELQIVGWYHTHPELGAFFSSDDVIVHSAAFVLPWHIGLVLDPVLAEACLVGWHQYDLSVEEKSYLIGIDGFYEVLDLQDQQSVNWRFVDPRLAYSDTKSVPVTNSSIITPVNDWPSLPPISPWWGVLIGGIGLLISLILLIDRLLSISE